MLLFFCVCGLFHCSYLWNPISLASGCFLIVLKTLLSQIPHSVTSMQSQWLQGLVEVYLRAEFDPWTASHWWQQRQTSGSVLVKSSLGIHLLCSEYSSKLEHKVEWCCKWIQFKLKIQAQHFTNYYLAFLKQKSVCSANRQIKTSKCFNTFSSNSSLVFHTYIYWSNLASLN